MHDWMTGLLSALCLAGQSTLPPRIDYPGARAYDRLQLLIKEEKAALKPDFRIRLHPIHRDSLTLHDAVMGAVQRGLLIIDSPGGTYRFQFDSEQARHMLTTLPGDEHLWQSCAQAFLSF